MRRRRCDFEDPICFYRLSHIKLVFFLTKTTFSGVFFSSRNQFLLCKTKKQHGFSHVKFVFFLSNNTQFLCTIWFLKQTYWFSYLKEKEEEEEDKCFSTIKTE